MHELRELARRILESGDVGVVIGWEQGPGGVRPAFVTDPGDVDRLVFDRRCVHCLAVYLPARRAQVRALGRPAVVVKGCDAIAAAYLARESQIDRKDVVLIGVRCGGVDESPRGAAGQGIGKPAGRCAGCKVMEPMRVDHVVGSVAVSQPDGTAAAAAKRAADGLFDRVAAMAPAERLEWWRRELERCVRCNACREVCPLCFCSRCVADKSQPQWIDTSPHARGNFAWHIVRAMHRAGRCIECGECERACPAGIPLGLINRRVAMTVSERFGYDGALDPDAPCPIGTYRLDDRQEFIL